jgi:hypothetical protein
VSVALCVVVPALAALGAPPARAQQPDLVPTMESATSIASLDGPGSGLQAVVTARNVGAAATQIAFWVRLYVGFGRTGCTADLGTVDEELIAMTLPAGGEVSGVSMQGGVPAGVDSSGIYRLCVEADSHSFVTESDETNNETSSTLEVVACLSDADCNDFVNCTVETCTNNVCSSAPVVCDDGDACTTDQCSIATGSCVFTPISCNDGDACTTDTCDPELGCRADPVDCDDGDPCKADGCGSAVGCFHTPIECPVAVPVGDATGWLVLVGLVAGLGALGAHRLARSG